MKIILILYSLSFSKLVSGDFVLDCICCQSFGKRSKDGEAVAVGVGGGKACGFILIIIVVWVLAALAQPPGHGSGSVVDAYLSQKIAVFWAVADEIENRVLIITA